MLRGADIRRRGQFEQGNAETIQIPFHLLAVVRRSRLQLPSAVLLQAQDVDADVPILGAQAPMCGEQRGPLEPGGVRSIHHRLPHRLQVGHGVHLEHRCHGQSDLQRVGIMLLRGRIVQFDQPSVRGPPVDEGAIPPCFESGRDVNGPPSPLGARDRRR